MEVRLVVPRSRTRTRYSQTGVSLIELVAVVAILAIIASLAAPKLSSTDDEKTGLVAAQVAEALRFARSEAIRTGLRHGVVVDHDGVDALGKDIVVYQLDDATSPFGVVAILRNPLSKQPYDIALSSNSLGRGVAIQNGLAAFDIDDLGRKRHIHFDAKGTPVYYDGGVAHRLLSGQVSLGTSQVARSVTLDYPSGRVSVR